MATAFQQNAFQDSGFQIDAGVVTAVIRSGPTRRQHVRYKQNAEHVLTPAVPVMTSSSPEWLIAGAAEIEVVRNQGEIEIRNSPIFAPTAGATQRLSGGAAWLLERPASVKGDGSASVTARTARSMLIAAGKVLPEAIEDLSEREVILLAMDILRRRRRKKRG